MQLNNKVAIVTGGASGLGCAIAQQYAREGASVVIADRDIERAKAVAADIESSGAKAISVEVDVASEASVRAMTAQAVDRFGPVGILVTSAGVGMQKAFMQTTLADWERITSINLTGAFLCGQAAAESMIAAGWGRIIHIASGAGLRGVPGRAAYGASKGGLIMLAKVMAVELGEHGITVNALAPGAIDTPMARQVHTSATRTAYVGATPLHRYGSLEEVAASATFLASDGAGYITGHTLEVDGGITAAGPMFKL
jgi:NAD(P)-dependent dehydrogenase (short-subunit alcohol dehydrogenase family)